MIVLDGVLRTASYGGLVLFVGVSVFLLYLWPEGRWSVVYTALAWTGWLVLVLSTIGLLIVTAARTHHDIRDVVATLVGSSLVARLALLGLAGAWLREVELTYGAAPYRAMASPKLITGGAVLALTPLTFVTASRSIRGSWAAAKTVLAATHVGAMTLWLGSLVVLAAVLMARDDSESAEVRDVLPRFSAVAAICATAIAVSGLLYALAQTDSVHRLTHSQYGALVLAKLVGFVAVVLIGNRARRYARARHAGEWGPRAVRGAVAVELIVALSVLGLSAALTLTAA